jgi:hypothetical protein
MLLSSFIQRSTSQCIGHALPAKFFGDKSVVQADACAVRCIGQISKAGLKVVPQNDAEWRYDELEFADFQKTFVADSDEFGHLFQSILVHQRSG